MYLPLPLSHRDLTDRVLRSVNIESFFDNGSQTWYFPKLFAVVLDAMMAVPRSWIQFHKPIASALANLDGCRERIAELQRESEANMSPSVFQTALHPNPAKGHPVLSGDDLAADALTMFTAGTDTTAHAFVTGTWKLMKHPKYLQKLQAVLKEAIPDPDVMNLDWSELEKIDYLVRRIESSEKSRRKLTRPSRVQSLRSLFACRMAFPARSLEKFQKEEPRYVEHMFPVARCCP